MKIGAGELLVHVYMQDTILIMDTKANNEAMQMSLGDSAQTCEPSTAESKPSGIADLPEANLAAYPLAVKIRP